MATVTFPYDHSRDPMQPAQLGNQIAAALGLTADPQVDISPTEIVVTASGVGEAKRDQIQAVINAYVYDAAWNGGPASVIAAKLVARLADLQAARAAITANPPTVFVNATNQERVLLRNLINTDIGLIRLVLGLLDGTD